MSTVTFDEEPHYARADGQTEVAPGSIIGLMYKLGIAKTKGDANIVMGGIIVACVVVSATVMVFIQPHQNPAQAAALQQEVDYATAYQKAHPSQSP